MTIGSVNLYNSHNTLLGNFTTIQEAVNYAAGKPGAGKTIVVDGENADGGPNPAFSEQVTIDADGTGNALTGLTI